MVRQIRLSHSFGINACDHSEVPNPLARPAPPLSPSLRAPPRPPPMELGQALSAVGARLKGGLPKEVSAALSTSKRLGAAQASLLTELADATVREFSVFVKLF